MEKRIRTKVEEYYVASDGNEFQSEQECLKHEQEIQKHETRSQRLQIIVKPSVGETLDRMVKENKIKSKNDLINNLIDNFLLENDTAGEVPVVRLDGEIKG